MPTNRPQMVDQLSETYRQLYDAALRRPHKGWLELSPSLTPLKDPLAPLAVHVDVLQDDASAQDRAKRAYQHAHEMFPGAPVYGVGVTETAQGIALASHDTLGTFSQRFVIPDASTPLHVTLVLRAMASASGLTPLPPADVEVDETVDPAPTLSSLHRGEAGYLRVTEAGETESGDTRPDLLVFSGSFYPLHRGHRHLADVAASLSDKPLHFELPLVNADKAPLDLAEARRRVQQFVRYRPVLLTKAPLFTDKAQRFPGSTFVVGADTAARLIDPRFYGDDADKMRRALDELTSSGCDFLVAGRAIDGRFTTLDDLDVPERFADRFRAIPAARFRDDVSATQLRRERAFGTPDDDV
ncbi:MAG: hypothetical protein U5L04_14655 [Trueperaceae bacterium]|nr:hypothetical protein [Trueperaceae bacterium]